MIKNDNFLKLIVNIAVFILVLLFALFVMPRLIVFFMPFVIGWIIAIIANPLVKFLEKRLNIVRKFSSMLIIIFVIGIIVTAGYFGVVKLYSEAAALLMNLPQFFAGIQEDLIRISENLKSSSDVLPANIRESFIQVTDELTSALAGSLSAIGIPTVVAAGNFAKNVPSALVNIIITILSAYFFIVRKESLTRTSRDIIPNSVLRNWNMILGNFKTIMGGYFKAQFKIMAIVGVILFTGFLILRIRFALLLAILISFLDFLPFFGTGAVLIPWAIFKLLSSDTGVAIGLIIIYVVSQLVRQVIQPKILGDTIGLDPLGTLFFMYIGYKLGSVLGLILAVPIGLIILNIYKEGYLDVYIDALKQAVNDINEYRRL